MAGRKRKFPEKYVIPFPAISEDEDVVEPSEAREQRDGQQEVALDEPLDDAILLGRRDAHGEHGANTDEDEDVSDVEGDMNVDPDLPHRSPQMFADDGSAISEDISDHEHDDGRPRDEDLLDWEDDNDNDDARHLDRDHDEEEYEGNSEQDFIPEKGN